MQSDRESVGGIPAGTLGMAIFLASLSMLFASSLVAFFVIRSRADSWKPATAGIPIAGVLISTLFLLGCSAAIQSALVSIRRGEQKKLRNALGWTVVLATLFLGSQIVNWIQIQRADLLYGYSNLYGFSFLMLTGLHALHVVGGIVGLIVVSVLAARGSYSLSHYPGVRMNAIYWHFIGLVWLVLLGVLIVGH